MSSLYQLQQKLSQLKADINKWETILSDYPDGRLISRKRDDDQFDYYYWKNKKENKKEEIYIPNSNRDFARQLALKEYAKYKLEDDLQEKRMLEKYLRVLKEDKKADLFLRRHPGAAELVVSGLGNKDPYVQNWASAEYRRSSSHPEHLKYPTIVPGLLVRSKSEADIISRFIAHGVPIRYEQEHIINGIAFHPDITGLNIRTYKEVYWEHQGAWDKPDYVDNQRNRDHLLVQAGIIPWKNLIITTETGDLPLDINWVDILIEYFYM